MTKENRLDAGLRPAVLTPFLLLGCLSDPATKESSIGTLMSVTEYSYNAQGKQILQVDYDGNEKELYRIASEYNASGNVTRSTFTTTATGAVDVTLFSYDGSGRLAEVSGSGGNRTTYTYTLAGAVHVRSVFSEGALDSRFEHAYDDQGRLVSVHEYGLFEFVPQGYLVQRKEYEYGGVTGWISKEARYGVDGGLELRHTYDYDDQGRIIEEVWEWVKRGLTDREETIYGEGGGFARKFYAGSNLQSHSEFDVKGNVVLSEFYNADGSVSSRDVYVNAYDGKGNMTRRERYLVI